MKKNMADIILVPLTIADREQFIKDNQEAFNYGALEMEIQGEEEQIDRVIMSINPVMSGKEYSSYYSCQNPYHSCQKT